MALSKRAALSRFSKQIIVPLIDIYQLLTTSVHIFYDLSGDLIAFNRGGSLFLNLRYYESWHDSDVQSNETSEALISWYHTLAHEIAVSIFLTIISNVF